MRPGSTCSWIVLTGLLPVSGGLVYLSMQPLGTAIRTPTATTMPENRTQLPALPFEVVRRIIHFRLALPQTYPAPIAPHAQYHPAWDAWTGARGREVESNMVAERRDVVRTAWGLVRVCKAWKVHLLRCV